MYMSGPTSQLNFNLFIVASYIAIGLKQIFDYLAIANIHIQEYS